MQKSATTYDDCSNHSSKYCDSHCKLSVRNNSSWGHSIFAYLSHAAFPWSYFRNLILQLTLTYRQTYHRWHFYAFYGATETIVKKIYFLTPFLLLCAKIYSDCAAQKTTIFLTCDWFISCLGVVNWKKFTLNFDTFRESENEHTKIPRHILVHFYFHFLAANIATFD